MAAPMSVVSLARLLIGMLTTASATADPFPLGCTSGGAVHLDPINYTAGTDTNPYWVECSLIGKPGTVIRDGLVSFYGDFHLGGTIRFQNVTMTGQIHIADGADVTFDDNKVTQGSLFVNGSSVSWTGGSFRLARFVRIVGSNATLAGVDFSANMGTFSIDASTVTMHGVGINMGYHCPSISNSAVIVNDSTLSCHENEEDWSIRNSEVKLTRSTLGLTHSSCDWCAGVAVVNSVVDATCAAGSSSVFQISSSSNAKKASMNVTNSTMHFNNCGCLTGDGPISTIGALNIKASTLESGECMATQPTQPVAQPDVMLV